MRWIQGQIDLLSDLGTNNIKDSLTLAQLWYSHVWLGMVLLKLSNIWFQAYPLIYIHKLLQKGYKVSNIYANKGNNIYVKFEKPRLSILGQIL